MKRIYLLVALLLAIGSNVFAQRTIDLNVTLASPTNGKSIQIRSAAPYDTFVVKVVYKNQGPSAINSGDTLYYAYSGSGGTYYAVFNKTLNMNDTTSVSSKFWYTGGTAGPATFCWAAIVRNGTTINTDPDTADNRACVNVTLTQGGTGVPQLQSNLNESNRVKQALAFYPNPANSEITMQYVSGSTSEVKARILDITGREVAVKNFGASYIGQTNFKMNVSSLPQGLYVIEVAQDGIRSIAKMNKD